ncbi:hypothetical protein SAV14893_079940 [Streptomyces avermitilis]|uniref:Uncharacterized protein n=1 Tax=Streptomyces avermitilis TaxID=33903 RepID=A0A4D4M9G4_STRAX|nr:hypothetical protein SAV14893_079940 [Streptomyces avermitilis]GDY71024.1 hypothetical protein SAV31267_005090 [Streptomyces avermitilis]
MTAAGTLVCATIPQLGALSAARWSALLGGERAAALPTASPWNRSATGCATWPDRRQPARCHPAPGTAERGPIDPGLRGRPRRKPRQLYADQGYDFDEYRRLP